MHFTCSLGYRLPFFNFSNKMKFHEDLISLKKTWGVILFFLSLMFVDTVCKTSHFLYIRQLAAEECEEADLTMALIFGASENILNTC